MIVTGPNNAVLTRAEIFEGMKKGQLDYETGYKTTIEKIEFFGNVAVTMGEDTYTPAFGPDKGKLLHRLSTNVWQYADGNWMMIDCASSHNLRSRSEVLLVRCGGRPLILRKVGL